MFTVNVKTKALPVAECLTRYCNPERFLSACQTCPEYANRWSCPPETPKAKDMLSAFQMCTLVGVQVLYGARMRAATTPEEVARLEASSYGYVKKILFETMLGLERVYPKALLVAAGRCEQCISCTRRNGEPCRRPDRMRYSFSGLGFDLTAMAQELLGIQLLWSQSGLPAYHVALAALFTNEEN